MKLVGFGCSFTYGSELLDPNLDNWDRHHENNSYRLSNCWLGKLAQRLDADSDNLAQPACSNYAISQIFYDWISKRDPNTEYTVCVAWTATDRMSWWDNGWIHDGFIRNEQEQRFKASFRDWLTYADRNTHITLQAKMFVNSVCLAQDIPVIQFDALDNINKINYPNFHMQGTSMQECLKNEGQRLNKNFFASGGHPNEQGHEYYVELMWEWIKGRKVVQ